MRERERALVRIYSFYAVSTENLNRAMANENYIFCISLRASQTSPDSFCCSCCDDHRAPPCEREMLYDVDDYTQIAGDSSDNMLPMHKAYATQHTHWDLTILQRTTNYVMAWDITSDELAIISMTH